MGGTHQLKGPREKLLIDYIVRPRVQAVLGPPWPGEGLDAKLSTAIAVRPSWHMAPTCMVVKQEIRN